MRTELGGMSDAMNATTPTDPGAISLARAMFCFGLAVVVAIYALVTVEELKELTLPSGYSRPTFGFRLVAVSIPAMFIALPGAAFFGGLLWLIGRKLSKPLGLAGWLITGVIALVPMAGVAWCLNRTFDRLDPPYAWDNIRGPLVLLAFGLVAALLAWRWRRARLAA